MPRVPDPMMRVTCTKCGKSISYPRDLAEIEAWRVSHDCAPKEQRGKR